MENPVITAIEAPGFATQPDGGSSDRFGAVDMPLGAQHGQTAHLAHLARREGGLGYWDGEHT